METLILFDSVSKAFEGAPVLDGFSHAFARDTLTFVEGPSGAGKTTLLRLACGLEMPDGGSIERAGDLRFSYAFQEDRLCENLSAAANVRLVCADRRSCRPEELLDALGIGDRSDIAAKKLSGGERRRVALARALAATCDVLLLDEPMTGLDEACRDRAVEVVRGELAGKAVLWVTHDTDERRSFTGYEVVELGKMGKIPV